MGRKWVLLLFLIFLFVLLCGCRATETAALPQLVIGYDNYRPYAYTDADGEPAGIDVELAREACRRMGYEPVFRHIDWGNRDNALESGAIDCLWSCFSMETDSENYAWVGPYMYSRQVVAVAESSDLKSLSDLAGKSIAVRLSSQAESALLGGTDSRIPALGHVYSLRNADEVITALRSGYVDACAGYASVLQELLENAGFAYHFLSEDLMRAQLGIAFRPEGSTELRKKLTEALTEMHQDGATARILEGYGLDSSRALGGNSVE